MEAKPALASLRSRAVVAVMALAAMSLGACRGELLWQIRFRSAADRDVTRRVDARVRTGSCDGPIVFETEISRDRGGMPAPALDPGVYGVEALAVDASCEIVARGCVLVTMPTSAGVDLAMDSVSPTALCEPSSCTDGRCSAQEDAGMLDAGPRDTGASFDAPPDAGRPDAVEIPIDSDMRDVYEPPDAFVPPDGFIPPDAFVPPDAWRVAPPVVVGPWNGVSTGTWRAVAGDVTDPPRRPLVIWRESPGALSYVLEMVACDERDLALCDFTTPIRRVVDDLTLETRPAADLVVDETSPGGRRYAFRVGACETASGSGCAFAPTRYLDVGRLREDLDGDGRGEMVVTRSATIESHGGVGSAPSPLRTIASGTTLGAVAYAGDVDADGRADVVLGAGGPTGRWEVRTFDGTLLGGADGAAATDRIAEVVAGVGDVDGDGYADVAISAPGLDEVHIQFGGDPMDPLARTVLTGTGLEDFALDISTAGDRDADGMADVAIVSRLSIGMVRAEIFSVAGRVARRLEVLELDSGEAGPMPLAHVAVVAGGTDLDGDRRPEVVIGLPSRGRAQVWLGDGRDGAAPGEANTGWAVAVGDLTGSGIGRVVIGSPGYLYSGVETGAYGHMSYFGSSAITWLIAINREGWGTQVSVADLDGDGRDDLFNFGRTGEVGRSGTFAGGMIGGGADFRFLFGNAVRHLAR